MGRQRAWFHLKRLAAAPPHRPLASPATRFRRLSPLPSRYLTPISPFLRSLSSNPAVSDSYDHLFVGGHQDDLHRHGSEPPEEEEVARYIPVKSYFVSTSIDLKSMQAENACNVIPPTSRSTNYVALRYSDSSPEVAEIGNKDNTSCDRYVVVFQYGSAVLFNIADHEAEHYLDLVRKHATGLFPEMRKDGHAKGDCLNKIGSLDLEDANTNATYRHEHRRILALLSCYRSPP